MKQVWFHPVSLDSPFCFLKADVTPSQRINEKQRPWVCITKSDGSVKCAHCDCMAGLGEACSHIAALLFKIEAAVKLGLTSASSTCQACKWNATYRESVEPTPITELFHLTKGKRSAIDTSSYVSRAPLPPSADLEELRVACPRSVFFTMIPKVDPEETDTASEDEHQAVEELLPPTITSLHDPAIDDISEEYITKQWSNYFVTDSQAEFLEERTRAQYNCELWDDHRAGRITGSKAHSILSHMRKDQHTEKTVHNLINRVMNYRRYDLSKKEQIKWGLLHENTAREMYVKHMENAGHTNAKCNLSGLKILPSKPYLAASADGIFTCDCHPKVRRIVEFKCPFKHRKHTVLDAAQEDAGFCINTSGLLKTSHSYHTQVQLQMLVNHSAVCDFVVFTECGIHVAIVRHNSEFCTELVELCDNFFHEYLLPELVTQKMRTTNLAVRREQELPSHAEQDSELDVDVGQLSPINPPTTCVCGNPEYGKMITCGNSDCEIGSYHYECVGILRKPRKLWMCPGCEEEATIDFMIN